MERRFFGRKRSRKKPFTAKKSHCKILQIIKQLNGVLFVFVRKNKTGPIVSCSFVSFLSVNIGSRCIVCLFLFCAFKYIRCHSWPFVFRHCDWLFVCRMLRVRWKPHSNSFGKTKQKWLLWVQALSSLQALVRNADADYSNRIFIMKRLRNSTETKCARYVHFN